MIIIYLKFYLSQEFSLQKAHQNFCYLLNILLQMYPKKVFNYFIFKYYSQKQIKFKNFKYYTFPIYPCISKFSIEIFS